MPTSALSNSVSYQEDMGVGILIVHSISSGYPSKDLAIGLQAGLARANLSANVGAIVILSEDESFLASHTITEISKSLAPIFFEALCSVEESAKPVIAVTHGVTCCFGLDVALCCNYRVALPGTTFEAPKGGLGFLPGGGGMQRLPRVIGIERALDMVIKGEAISSSSALHAGLIDHVIDGDIRKSAISFASSKARLRGKHSKTCDKHDFFSAGACDAEYLSAFRDMVGARIFRDVEVEYHIRCTEAAVNLPFKIGVERERDIFEELYGELQSITPELKSVFTGYIPRQNQSL